MSSTFGRPATRGVVAGAVVYLAGVLGLVSLYGDLQARIATALLTGLVFGCIEAAIYSLVHAKKGVGATSDPDALGFRAISMVLYMIIGSAVLVIACNAWPHNFGLHTVWGTVGVGALAALCVAL